MAKNIFQLVKVFNHDDEDVNNVWHIEDSTFRANTKCGIPYDDYTYQLGEFTDFTIVDCAFCSRYAEKEFIQALALIENYGIALIPKSELNSIKEFINNIKKQLDA